MRCSVRSRRSSPPASAPCTGRSERSATSPPRLPPAGSATSTPRPTCIEWMIRPTAATRGSLAWRRAHRRDRHRRLRPAPRRRRPRDRRPRTRRVRLRSRAGRRTAPARRRPGTPRPIRRPADVRHLPHRGAQHAGVRDRRPTWGTTWSTSPAARWRGSSPATTSRRARDAPSRRGGRGAREPGGVDRRRHRPGERRRQGGRRAAVRHRHRVPPRADVLPPPGPGAARLAGRHGPRRPVGGRHQRARPIVRERRGRRPARRPAGSRRARTRDRGDPPAHLRHPDRGELRRLLDPVAGGVGAGRARVPRRPRATASPTGCGGRSARRRRTTPPPTCATSWSCRTASTPCWPGSGAPSG